MNTTAVFIEILIVGIEAVAWLALLLMSIFGTGAIKHSTFDGWQSLASFLLLSMAYVLGIVTDRLADSVYSWVRDETRFGEYWLQQRFGSPRSKRPASVSSMRLAVMAKDDGRAKFLDYQRSRQRIARATVLNLVPLFPFLLLFLTTRTDFGWLRVFMAGILNLAFIPVALYAAERIGDAYMDRLIDAYKAIKEEGGEPVPKHKDNCRRAGAVCYRRGDQLMFAVVSTKDHEYWTLPKGGIKPSEEPWKAAKREAREEAGVRGDVEKEPVATYEYVGSSRDEDCTSFEVTAYLLRVTREKKPRGKDRKRLCEWADAARAKELLANKRPPDLAAEHARVIDAAVARLTRPSDNPATAFPGVPS